MALASGSYVPSGFVPGFPAFWPKYRNHTSAACEPFVPIDEPSNVVLFEYRLPLLANVSIPRYEFAPVHAPPVNGLLPRLRPYSKVKRHVGRPLGPKYCDKKKSPVARLP